MMNPLYSVLTNEIIDFDVIENYLSSGIKVIQLIDVKDKSILFGKSGLDKYMRGGLYFKYFYGKSTEKKITVYDGKMSDEDKKSLDYIVNDCNLDINFNYEQYLIEHCDTTKDILVTAGAGTGKTTVMIDRILFLLHTVKDITLEDIGMITFTNDATSNMKEKIQEKLHRRLDLTYDSKYVVFLEKISSMRISTIDSFSNHLISEFGANIGYGNGLSTTGLRAEKEEIIKKALNKYYIEKSAGLGEYRDFVKDVLGLPFHSMVSLVTEYWDKLCQLGFDEKDLDTFDWGESRFNVDSTLINSVLKSVIKTVFQEYREYQINNDSIEVGDIGRELGRILEYESNDSISLKTHRIKYLFVDEFQDSDKVQIETILELKRRFSLNLFIVGDPKQSIYRFRGAVGNAFDLFKEQLLEVIEFSLTKNYRTSQNVLYQFHEIFSTWADLGILKDYSQLIPVHMDEGKVEPLISDKGKLDSSKFTSIVRKACKENIEKYVENGKAKLSDHVVVLTRTNMELKEIADICSRQGIKYYFRMDGGFYTSHAVLDFFDMVSFVVFPTSAATAFNYLYTPYAAEKGILNKLASCEQYHLSDTVFKSLEGTDYKNIISAFRTMPLLAALDKIICFDDILNRLIVIYEMNLKAQINQNSPRSTYSYYSKENDFNNGKKNFKILSLQYLANLKKLLQIIRQNFSVASSSVYDLYEFLKIKINSDTTENEAEIDDTFDGDVLLGMTVHKAKGLEFNTVIMPMTDFCADDKTTIIVKSQAESESYKVGWQLVQKKDIIARNDNYNSLFSAEDILTMQEEVRLLYVALTRCKHSVYYFVPDDRHILPGTWGSFLTMNNKSSR